MTRVAILGSGIIGTTVAIAIAARGHEVTLIGDRRMSDPDATSDPIFASGYPAASVIPHTVGLREISHLTKVSESFFAALVGIPNAGVRVQRHAEIFEVPYDLPLYAHSLTNLTQFDQKVPEHIPIRAGASIVGGYEFDCFFCDMPIYGRWLDAVIDKTGVIFERQTLTSYTVKYLDFDYVVNCLGARSHQLFPDLEPGFISRGILLVDQQSYTTGELTSYNYTPVPSQYGDNFGRPQDVYFYPRRDSAILGGTRQIGSLKQNGSFVPASRYAGQILNIGGTEVPSPILQLNSDLIQQLTGKSPDLPLEALVGYRHLAGTPEDPKVALADVREMKGWWRIDCLGFGGAGVTLSWGVASKVVKVLDDLVRHETVGSTEDVSALIENTLQFCRS